MATTRRSNEQIQKMEGTNRIGMLQFKKNDGSYLVMSHFFSEALNTVQVISFSHTLTFTSYLKSEHDSYIAVKKNRLLSHNFVNWVCKLLNDH